MNENEIVVERDVGDHSISKVEIRGNGEQPLGTKNDGSRMNQK